MKISSWSKCLAAHHTRNLSRRWGGRYVSADHVGMMDHCVSNTRMKMVIWFLWVLPRMFKWPLNNIDREDRLRSLWHDNLFFFRLWTTIQTKITFYLHFLSIPHFTAFPHYRLYNLLPSQSSFIPCGRYMSAHSFLRVFLSFPCIIRPYWADIPLLHLSLTYLPPHSVSDLRRFLIIQRVFSS